MSNGTDISTEFLVLRRTPYAETSLVVAGLTPDYGQLHFLARGARRLGKRQFPVLDLFRAVSIRFRMRQEVGALHSPRSVELVADHSALARDIELFGLAGWAARFCLDNVLPGVAQPRIFQALRVTLRRLADAAVSRTDRAQIRCAAMVCLSLTYLDENGLLPEYGATPAAERQCRLLLEAAGGQAEIPPLTLANWQKMRQWAVALLHYAECRVPDL